MDALTIRVTAAATGYSVTLLDGDPASDPPKAIVEDTPSPLALTLGGDAATPDEVREFFVSSDTASPRFREIGEALGRFLFPAPIRDEWNKRRRARTPLHTYLWIVPPELAPLPWELLYHGTQIGLSPETPLVRWRDAVSKANGPVTWQIGLLVVVGSSGQDFGIKAAEEVAAIEHAVWNVDRVIDVHVMREPPTEDVLLAKLKTYHPDIVHFIGHGSTVTIQNGDTQRSEGVLWFESQPAWPCTHDKIHLLMQGAARRPRMVFLNACRTFGGAAPTANDQNQIRSVADAFQAEGVPAVIAMQADVWGAAAALHAEEFYTRLAAGDTIDLALANARLRSSLNKDLNERTHYLPAVMTCRPVDDIVSVPALQADELTAIASTDAFSIVRQFVDRRDHRRNIFLSCGSPTLQERKPVIVVNGVTVRQGEKEVPPGKSALVHWFLEGCARRRVQIRYVGVAGEEQIGWLELLRIIRDGDPESQSLPDRPFPPAAFRVFNWGLKHRLAGAEPGPMPAAEDLPDPIDDGYQPPGASRASGDEFIKKTFADFRAGLAALASPPAPVVIVLDHFTRNTVSFTPSDFAWLRQHLLVPVLNNIVKDVHIVLVLTAKEMVDYELKKRLGAAFANIELEDLTNDHFFDLATEFLRLSKVARDDDEREVLERWLKYKAKKWPYNWKIPALCDLKEQAEGMLK